MKYIDISMNQLYGLICDKRVRLMTMQYCNLLGTLKETIARDLIKILVKFVIQGIVG